MKAGALDQARSSNSCSGFTDIERDELEAIARFYVDADNLFMKLVNWAGKATGDAMSNLPDSWKAPIADATAAALNTAWKAAESTQPKGRTGFVAGLFSRTSGEGFHRLATAFSGAVGGAGGALTTLALDLPATTTLILRSIQQIAADYGEDIASPEVTAQCLGVFAMGGPLPEDDEGEIGLLAARLALSGTASAALVASIAPRFGIIVSEKFLAQIVPILGAVTGAAINLTFTSYYQKMAHVHFRLRKLESSGEPEQVLACFERMVRGLLKPAEAAA